MCPAAFALTLAAVGCGGPQPVADAPQPEVETQAAAEEIEEAVRAFFAAYDAQDADSVTTFWTEDAILMPPGRLVVRGHAELGPHIASAMGLGRWIQSTTTDVIDVFGSDAVQVGTYSVRFEPTDASPEGMSAFEYDGRYMIHWSKVGGRWLIDKYLSNQSS